MLRIAPRERLRAGYAALLQVTGRLALSQRDLRRRAVVLMYHRVLDDDEIRADIKPGMYVTTSTFERHLRYLSTNHQVVGLDDLHAWLLGQRSFPRIPTVITFDDGWADNYTRAFPLLTRYGLTATVFVITGQIGEPEMLTWEQVREMEAAGIDFGSHTVTHPMLTTVDEHRARVELTDSLDRLRREVRRPSRWFCYPKGAYNEQTLQIARELYAGALTTEDSTISRGDDMHRLRRIGIHNDVTRTTALFACRLVSLV